MKKQWQIGDVVVYTGNTYGVGMASDFLGRVGTIMETSEESVVVKYLDNGERCRHYAINFSFSKEYFEIKL